MEGDLGHIGCMHVHKKIHKTVQVMVLINKFLICVSNF